MQGIELDANRAAWGGLSGPSSHPTDRLVKTSFVTECVPRLLPPEWGYACLRDAEERKRILLLCSPPPTQRDRPARRTTRCAPSTHIFTPAFSHLGGCPLTHGGVMSREPRQAALGPTSRVPAAATPRSAAPPLFLSESPLLY
eukprot:187912-Chlamydomonas_euryale.AAC.4